MTPEQLLAHGMNHSVVHEDVMVGAADTHITGLTRKGETVEIFSGGEWVL
jgi:aminopeptidase